MIIIELSLHTSQATMIPRLTFYVYLKHLLPLVHSYSKISQTLFHKCPILMVIEEDS